jgi:LysM repeat protein
MARSSRRSAAHYLAPAAFLLAATVLALLIHSALGGRGISPGGTTTQLGPVTPPSARVPGRTTRTVTSTHTSGTDTTSGAVAGAAYATVQSGDTFGSIAARNGTSVSELEGLNPGVSSNSLQVGQRIRVK